MFVKIYKVWCTFKISMYVVIKKLSWAIYFILSMMIRENVTKCHQMSPNVTRSREWVTWHFLRQKPCHHEKNFLKKEQIGLSYTFFLFWFSFMHSSNFFPPKHVFQKKIAFLVFSKHWSFDTMFHDTSVKLEN